VLNLAARYHVDPAHTEHVARLAMGLFDELADAGLHPGDRWERELLFSACILHDIGMSVDYDDHHKHSRYLILNAGLPGFAPRELALIAQAARYHRKGTPDLGELAPLAQDGDAERLDRMALLLRLAEDLERSRDQSVRAAHIAADDGTLHLELETDGAAAVERWAAEREVDLVERAFGRQLKVEAA
jgi:exopolyphosphatase/guanosine-5'-triphosphate,3'-diphosphate pyrophosphatase